MAERMYKVRVTRGVIIHGEGMKPDGKGGPIVELNLYDSRSVVGAKKGVYVDKKDTAGPMSTSEAGAGLVKGRGRG